LGVQRPDRRSAGRCIGGKVISSGPGGEHLAGGLDQRGTDESPVSPGDSSQHHNRARRVSNKDWVARALHAFAWTVPGEHAPFDLDELERAKEWAAS
jgi:hypothetical protein